MTLHAVNQAHHSSRHIGFDLFLQCGTQRGFDSWAGSASAAAQTPATGSKEPDFTLSTPAGNSVHLTREVARGETVLVVLRGFPGYQCPIA